MKCSNCDSDALFIYQVTTDSVFPYCGKHLPRFLDARRKAGLLKTTDAWEKEKNASIEALKVTPNETVTEEPVTEESAPKKKAAAKKKAK